MLFKTRPNGAHPGSGRAPLVDDEGRQIVILEGPTAGGGTGGAVIGAIAWNLVTWYLGLPSSSSHALLGGYGGAAVAKAGAGALWHARAHVLLPM